MTKTERQTKLFNDWLKIYKQGTCKELQNKIERLCKKHFPNCDIIFINITYSYFYALREAYYFMKDLQLCIKNYKDK